MPKIKVHEKALAHLSRGLYRSPASALRELVSNAWDANATIVRINTNYPNFYLLSVEDNGDGFTREEFENLMEGGIGNSTKRVEQRKLINDRPIIGRLGIGMLGIAQICGAFTITSKTRDGNGFSARVRLYDRLKDKLDDQVILDEEVDIGIFDIDNTFDPTNANQGTIIISDEVHPTFIRTFQRSLELEKFTQPPLGDWRKVLNILNKSWSLQELGDYWRLIWELAASCPVPYIDENALPSSLIENIQKKLLKYDFTLIVDGIKLYKPVLLSDNPGGYTFIKIDKQLKVYNKDLYFHGYLIVQEGLQLKPDELRGILIRIKNIAVGYYDPSLLDFRRNEGPRNRWITGEIYVDEGLENALNVDRDSFNRFHPEFRAVQEYIHTILEKKIFPVTYTKIKERSIAKEKTREETRNELLESVISNSMNLPVQIHTKAKELETISRETKEGEKIPKVELTTIGSEVSLTLPAFESLGTRKNYRQLSTAIMSIFEIAIQEQSPEKQREIFTNLLLDLLKGW